MTLYFNGYACNFTNCVCFQYIKQRPEDGRLDGNRLPKINKYKVVLDGAVYTVYC